MAKPGAIRVFALGLLLLLVYLAMVLGWDGALVARREAFAASYWPWLWGETAFFLGQGAVQITPLALVAIWGFWRGLPKCAARGLAGVSAVVFSGLVIQVMKHLVGRPRPRLAIDAWAPFSSVIQMDLNSFPSGHSTTSFALAAALAPHFPRLGWLLYLLAAFVAVGRLFSGSHHLSDVAGGAVVGLAMGWVLGQASQRWLARLERRPA